MKKRFSHETFVTPQSGLDGNGLRVGQGKCSWTDGKAPLLLPGSRVLVPPRTVTGLSGRRPAWRHGSWCRIPGQTCEGNSEIVIFRSLLHHSYTTITSLYLILLIVIYLTQSMTDMIVNYLPMHMQPHIVQERVDLEVNPTPKEDPSSLAVSLLAILVSLVDIVWITSHLFIFRKTTHSQKLYLK